MTKTGFAYMGTNYTIEIDSRTGIRKVLITGKITKEQYLTIHQELRELNNLPKSVMIIEDTRLADIDFHPSEITEIKRHLQLSSNKFEMLRIASITDNPRNTVFSTLLSQNMNSQNYQHEVFSTEEFALKWLKNESDNS
ncbi:MAG: STAS/SEC14 domain-containing protein [Bacteroidales bacterium]|nr:STAS/SEC14 domain-containing protein [Bacteroidales bacterium]